MSYESVNDRKLAALVAELDLPEKAYDSATRRYKDLGSWFDRPESSVSINSPHIFVQGSFALGTAIRPLNDGEEYDLDLACKLREGVSRSTHSQERLKNMVGIELEHYRRARGIQEKLDEKHRCWRLQYQDELRFHMDVVPCIPAEEIRQAELTSLMEGVGMDRRLSVDLASKAVWITDDQRENYRAIDLDWPASNPEGYMKWFVSQMEEKGATKAVMDAARVDEVPLYHRKSALQRVIQLLKRHRDVMFKDAPDSKPISIIITTLAARSYLAGEPLEAALRRILAGLKAFRQLNSGEVLNPVNPKENFADRWERKDSVHLQLKRNFHRWVDQVSRDYEFILDSFSHEPILDHVSTHLAIKPSTKALTAALGLEQQAALSATEYGPRHVEIAAAPPKPWCNG